MMHSIELDDAKEHFHELVEQAIRGEEVVITKDQQPLVKLVATTTPPRQRHFGSAKGLVLIADDLDAPLADFAEYK